MLRMTQISIISLLLLALSPLHGAEKLTITGSSTVAPLALEIAKSYERKHPGVRIDVQTGGSSRGIADVRQNVAHIGMVSRQLKQSEKDLTPHLIAKDGLAIIINKQNPIKNLKTEDIVKIYKGQITNWKSLGGKDKKITVVNKAEGRSTLELFLKFYKLKNSQIRPQIIIGDNEQGIKIISTNPAAIGYVSIGAAEYSIKNNIAIKLLPTNGIFASTKNVEKNIFPLARQLNFVTKSKQNEISNKNNLAEKFIAYAQSPEVYELIKKQYFIPIKK